MKVGVVQLPGLFGDRDMLYALLGELHVRARLFPHKSTSFSGADAVIIPGGASFGDHLRAGAIARVTPVIRAIKEFATSGGPVMGIGNGFQVLCEAGLLPGALLENNTQEHIYSKQLLNVDDCTQNFSQRALGEEVELPISHRFGRYWIDNDGLNSLRANNQIMFRYKKNPNGSVADIAGIRNRDSNVFGMMPHPEAAVENGVHFSTIGARILRAFLKQPRVEPQKPSLPPELQEELEALLLGKATQFELESIHAYFPRQELLLSINGEKTLANSEPNTAMGEFLHKFHLHASDQHPNSIATTSASNYFVVNAAPEVAVMVVGKRQKIALVRLIKSLEELSSQVSLTISKD